MYHWLPIILAIYLPACFAITYSIAIAYGHVERIFPYASHTGIIPPESSVFGQLLNIGALLCGVVVTIRYRQVLSVILLHSERAPERKGIRRLNAVSFVVGLLTSLGVSIVGNFQATSESAAVQYLHVIGASMAFGYGFVYSLLQTVMSYNMRETGCLLTVLRAFLCVLDLSVTVLAGVTLLMANELGKSNDKPDYLWIQGDPGYTEHLISAISEWLIAVILAMYFGTFYMDFKQFRMKSAEIVVPSNLVGPNSP